MYIILLPVFELVLDEALVSVSAHYVTPLFNTTEQIIYTIVTLLSSVFLTVYTIAGLKKNTK